MSFPFIGSGAGITPPLATLTPDDSNLSYSDYCIVSVNSSRARFTRPTVDGQGFEFVNPGARVRIRTNSPTILVTLQWTNLLLTSLYNPFGVILIDGVQAAQFSRPSGAAGPTSVLLSPGLGPDRVIEVVMPYCASVDFASIGLVPGSTVSNAPARPATRYVAIGDSITHSFYASDVVHGWPYILAAGKPWQYINHGYGGRLCVPADGTTLGGLNPTVATYLIGFNDYYGQLALATFKANFIAFVNNFRAINATAKLYCLTPIYSPFIPPGFAGLTLEMYRQQIRDALTTLANPLNILVEGLPLMTNNVNRLTDDIHPNDLGSSEIAASLASIVNV